MFELWNEGEKTREIARRTGMSQQAVINLVARHRRNGVPLARREGPPKDAQSVKRRYQQLEALWAEGVSIDEIAAQLGYSSSESVYGAIRLARARGYDLPRRYASWEAA